MKISIAKLLGVLSLSLILVLAACNGEEDDSAQPGLEDPTPTGAVEATPDDATPTGATPEATPEDATPEATPDDEDIIVTPEDDVAVDEKIDLRLAYAYLVEQDSFAMNIDIDGLPGDVDELTGAEDGATIVVRQSGEDRHVQILDAEGNETLAEVWRVGDEHYVDMGMGVQQVDPNDPMAQQAMMYADIHGRMLTLLDAPQDTHYELVGSEEVNGQNTNIHEASYEILETSFVDDVPFFIGVQNASVDTTMWVHEEDGYLVRAEILVQPENGDGESTITVNVNDIGNIDNIEAPEDAQS